MIKSFDGLSGTDLENWFSDLFKSEMAFDYFPTQGQIELHEFDPSIKRGHHLEIDGILLLNKSCVFLEYTGQARDFKDKIKKFTRNCNLFITSKHLTKREKFKIFGIPNKKLDDFEETTSNKFVYIGTNNAFEKQNLTRRDFPDYPVIQQALYILKPTNVEYLRQLTGLIGHHSRNEFLGSLDFKPSDIISTSSSSHYEYLKVENKFVTTNRDVKADIYLLKFEISDLLRKAKVSRYEGIPYLLDEHENENYQRFLIQQKLTNISNNFIQNSSRATFPNTITIVLPEDCKEEDKEGKQVLTIPNRYGAIDIIDGQHRLFAYTNRGINNRTRDNGEILASAIKFHNNKNAQRFSAKVFCEINANQAKVKNNLLYLIKFDVLGDTDHIAMAGKILLECNKGTSNLSDVFMTNSLRKKNKLGLSPIPITTIVDSDIVPFLKGMSVKHGTEISDAIFESVFGHKRAYFKKKPLLLINKAKGILEQYFNNVATVFSNDWNGKAESHLLSAKYLSGFIRLLRYVLFDEKKSLPDVKKVLEKLKADVDAVKTISSPSSFSKIEPNIPTTKVGINKIFDFLLSCYKA